MSKTTTSLSNKHSEPMIIRRLMKPYGFPIYIALICGDDLSDLDEIHDAYAEGWAEQKRGIQDLRNYFGNLTELLVNHYDKAEGVAVVAFADKLVISSLWGDFMVHLAVKNELMGLLNMTTLI